LRVVAGAAHYSACHFAEELGDVEIAEFREKEIEESVV
jgi:hypothetical protein